MSERLVMRRMDRKEVDDLVDQAAMEGWNPGLHDASVFWLTDPQAFVVAEIDGKPVGAGSITGYDGEFGFMGFFIVRPMYRGRGYGTQLWHERKRLLQERLGPGAVIGMDGVFEMQSWYARGGFVFSHRQIRYASTGVSAARTPSVVPATEVSPAALLAYDRTCFPADRARFIRAWLAQPDSLALASHESGRLNGYGVIRRCREGAKIGPLFADDPTTARQLYASLATFAAGENVYLDVPENNAAAMALAADLGMRSVFEVARMYLGAAPSLRSDRIYGNTTFELG